MPRITPVHWQTLERVFLAAGFHFVRQEGSHRSYSKPGILRPIVIPAYKQVPVSIIRNNLRPPGFPEKITYECLRSTDSSRGRLALEAPPCSGRLRLFVRAFGA